MFSEPNHAPAEVYVPQHSGKKGKTFRFQFSWYKTFPWLHHEVDVNGVLCFYCMKSHDTHGSHAVSKNADPAFAVNEFHNCKKPVEKFKVHQSTRTPPRSAQPSDCCLRSCLCSTNSSRRERETACCKYSSAYGLAVSYTHLTLPTIYSV